MGCKMALVAAVLFGCSIGMAWSPGWFPTLWPTGTEATESLGEDQPVELGSVIWGRDLDEAQSVSKQTGKPIFLLFQEIPGCETCQGFGKSLLSHPLMVEAIEDLFVPVVVYNNRAGEDARLLKEFGEPSWNNPVVRFLDARRKDLIPRKDRVWDLPSVAKRMSKALREAKRNVPQYLLNLSAESTVETATFAMHCFWEGEAKLGSINGVLNTRSGWKQKLEVVQLIYRPEVVTYDQLVNAAKKFECASTVFAHSQEQLKTARAVVGDRAVLAEPTMRDAKLSDQVYYLRNSHWRHLALTEWQATKINGLIYQQISEDDRQRQILALLSPRQQRDWREIRSLLKQDPGKLDEFVWPDKDASLSTYVAELRQELYRR